ncbi:hypothetical protein ACFPIF_19430 [Brevundimonas faecalis]|uniref:hypothetical protein n=1 Tax=Brevundimonas faecalis TaxID=947378 RepID=UPI003610621C
MAITDVTICNMAIGRCSGDRIDAMDEESPLGAFCAENYAHKREFILSKYRWTFANAVALLARVDPAANPDAVRPMAHQYAKPADLIGAVHDWRETADPHQSRRRPYVMEVGGSFWSDETPLYAEYTAQRAEGAWPAWFRQLVVTAFAAEVADFCQLTTKANALRAEAWGTPQENGEGGLYASARNEDARLAPPRQLETGVDAGPLVQARWGGSPFAGRGWEVQG